MTDNSPKADDARIVNRWRAARDGDCLWKGCPQLNPKTSASHCILDVGCSRCGHAMEECEC